MLLYGSLLTFKPLRIALMDVIRMNIRLVEGRSDEIIWEDEPFVIAENLDEQGTSLEQGLKNRFWFALFEKVVRSPLSFETDRLTDKIIFNLRRVY